MKLDFKHIKQKPIYIDVLLWFGSNTAQAIYPNVYLSRLLYDDAHSSNPSPYTIGLILHEQEHNKRIAKTGVFKWYAKYLFSPKFRITEELAAIKPQFEYIKKSKLTLDLELKAKHLSGWLYLWPCDYASIHTKLVEIWDAI